MERSLNDSGLDLRMDDSLTDMQWLQRMDAGSEIPGFVQKPIRKRLPKSDKENQRLPKHTKDGCRKRLHYDSTAVGEGGGREAEKAMSNKPPLSYASLIVLAISSTPQRMLTLSGIYRWIESTFPFYRTPESKAWKNSIRHNLSIRKNMFTKVHQYPPRRGNGSYWTLLSDGEDELARAHPLFTTLLPPIIDPDSVYCRTPLTHTVKSRGQFMPVLPDTNRKTPYFALDAPANDGSSPVVTHSLASPPAHFQEIEVTTATKKQKRVAEKCPNMATVSEFSTHHLLEHSYSKMVTFEPELQLVEEELAAEDLVEGSFIPHSSAGMESGQGGFMEQGILQVGACDSTTDIPHTPVTTPTHPDHAHMDSVADCSLTSLLGTSFLTPTKMAAISDLSFDAISFSPLYNFVTPQREGASPSGQPAVMSSHSGNHGNTLTPNIKHCHENRSTTPLRSETCSNTSNETGGIFPRTADPIPVPVSDHDTTPSHSSSITGIGISELDSGVFSPFSTSLRFSTPLRLKSVSPLPGNMFSTPQPTEPTGNAARNFGGGGVYRGTTPTRKSGSRQLFPFSFSSPTS
jgi:hypothetical protein